MIEQASLLLQQANIFETVTCFDTTETSMKHHYELYRIYIWETLSFSIGALLLSFLGLTDLTTTRTDQSYVLYPSSMTFKLIMPLAFL